MTDTPIDQKALEAAKAVEDDMRWMAADRHIDIQPLVRERLIEGADMIERFRSALSRRVPASGELEPVMFVSERDLRFFADGGSGTVLAEGHGRKGSSICTQPLYAAPPAPEGKAGPVTDDEAKLWKSLAVTLDVYDLQPMQRKHVLDKVQNLVSHVRALSTPPGAP